MGNGAIKTEKIIMRHRGVVVNDTMDKTIIIAVEQFKTHPKYLKKYRSTKRYKVHDEQNHHKVGETVEFIACRKRSNGKSHTIVAQKVIKEIQ